jgi:uncharacterized protein (DUF488 family)
MPLSKDKASKLIADHRKIAERDNKIYSQWLTSRIWTIGHSTRKIDIFISLLKENRINLVADVRMFPGSKRYPHFNKDALAKSLVEVGIRYEHFLELGGRRRAKANSQNTAWRNEAFRGYADYMETEDFRRGIERLIGLAEGIGPTSIMCAEAVWWRCHRALISDFLKVRDVEVIHIIDFGQTESHPFTSAAKIVDGELDYRARNQLL